MTTAFMKKLRDDLTRAKAAAEKANEDVELLCRIVAYYEERSEDVNDGPTHAPAAKALTNEMWKILEEEGTPLHYQEIHSRLGLRGVEVPGKDPKRNVGAHLSADPRFDNVKRGLWGLRSWGGSPPGYRADIARGEVEAVAPILADERDMDAVEDAPLAGLLGTGRNWRPTG